MQLERERKYLVCFLFRRGMWGAIVYPGDDVGGTPLGTLSNVPQDITATWVQTLRQWIEAEAKLQGHTVTLCSQSGRDSCTFRID